MRDQTLGDVDKSLVETGKFLQEFVSDSEKLQCLQIFAKCLNMVNWIRKETKGNSINIISHSNIDTLFLWFSECAQYGKHMLSSMAPLTEKIFVHVSVKKG